MAIQPLDEIPIEPLIASLPKAELHLHQEDIARFERVVARRQGRLPHNWRESAQRLMAETLPGESRLVGMYKPDASLDFGEAPVDAPESIIAKIVDALEEGAADGAILVEIRFGLGSIALRRPDFMELFREAERQVQARYPQLCAEAIGYLSLDIAQEYLQIAEQQLKTCLRAADGGLAGIDFRTYPYETEAVPALWAIAYRMAERAAEAGLGITVHAGEFSAANLWAALQTPGLSRLGHAVYAASDEHLMEQLAQRNITIECSLSCNVVLGATPSYEAHPIRQFVEAGIPVTLNTDNPVRSWTTIGREYAIASALGFSSTALLSFTRNAVQASFTSAERRKALMDKLDQWEAEWIPL